MIRNTTADMNDPLNVMLLLGEAMLTGTADTSIEAMEKRGQTELVNSDRLPVDTDGADAEFEALGFTFGEPDPGDPLFRPAALPDGWTRQTSDHDMWSYLLDEHGRRRVAIFYKAAFYDRSAFMRLDSVDVYVYESAFYGSDIVTDDAWATPTAVVDCARERIARIDEQRDFHSGEARARQDAERACYEAVIARLTAA